MRKIARHHSEIYLPFFIWAERQRQSLRRSTMMAGYRVGPRLDVQPIWTEARSWQS